jgi:glycosyltransferase involved in cell wall biosynthesis
VAVSELPSRVGINAVFLRPGMGGLETYLRQIMPELLTAAPDIRFSIYASRAGAEHLSQDPWSADVDFVTHPLLGLPGLKALTETTVLGWLAGRQVDLLHNIAMTGPLRTRALNLVFLPDIIWLHGDHPDLTTRLWRLILPAVARRADRVLAPSLVSAAEIERELRVPADRIDLTPLGHTSSRQAVPVEPAEVRRRFGLGEGPLILSVGTRKPHKNILGLIEAMPAVLAAVPAAQLVLAGNVTAHEPELVARVTSLKLEESVRLLGFASDEELEGLYGAATCFVLASFEEGFGLPILEAMGRGLPVACSNVSALPEVAGGAARLFDPARPDEISTALVELLSKPDLRHRLIARGHAREQALSWGAAAHATLDSYARAWRERARAGPAGTS